MELVLWLLVIQGVIGAFDLVYHHEMTEKLTWKPSAANEMWLHGLRNGLYAIIFLSLGFLQWHGALAILFLIIVVVEVVITLCDFVIEDRTRELPATERVAHTILALNYGAVLGMLIPEILIWIQYDTGWVSVNYGLLSWIMGIYGVGVLAWFFRDYLRSLRLRVMANNPPQPIINTHIKGKRILITGGTGFIGKALTKSLLASDCEVTLLTRRNKYLAYLQGERYQVIHSMAQLSKSDQFDVVINLAGEPIAQRWSKKCKQRILESRLGITQQIVEFISNAENKPELLINGSAIGWYGTSPELTFDENSAPCENTVGTFARTVCKEWEETARKAEDFGVRTVLLRTGIVLEKDGGTLSELLFPFDFGLGGPLGNGRQWFSWIHRDDVIGLILKVITEHKFSGVLNAVAPEPVTNREFSKALGHAMTRPVIFFLPAWVLKFIFGEMAEEVMLHGQKVFPMRSKELGYQFQFTNLNSALNAIFKI